MTGSFHPSGQKPSSSCVPWPPIVRETTDRAEGSPSPDRSTTPQEHSFSEALSGQGSYSFTLDPPTITLPPGEASGFSLGASGSSSPPSPSPLPPLQNNALPVPASHQNPSFGDTGFSFEEIDLSFPPHSPHGSPLSEEAKAEKEKTDIFLAIVSRGENPPDDENPKHFFTTLTCDLLKHWPRGCLPPELIERAISLFRHALALSLPEKKDEIFLIACASSCPAMLFREVCALSPNFLVEDSAKENALHKMVCAFRHDFCLILQDKLGNSFCKLLHVQNTKSGKTPLHYACLMGNAESASFLLLLGASPVLPDSHGDTPLSLACCFNHLGIVSQLIGSGCSLSHANKEGNTALHLAYLNASLPLIELLIKAGADENVVNTAGFLPCHLGYKNKNQEVVSFVIEKKWKPWVSFPNGSTAFDMALQSGHLETFKKILPAMMGQKGHQRYDEGAVQQAILDVLLSGTSEMIVFFWSVLINLGFPRNNIYCGENNETLFHLLCSREDWEDNDMSDAISFFLQEGYDPNFLNAQDQTSLMSAVLEGNEDLFLLLAPHMTTQSLSQVDLQGRTLLHHAASTGMFSLFQSVYSLLEQYHIHLALYPDREGQNILHLACQSSDGEDLVRWILLQRLVDVSAVDGSGQTALSYALQQPWFSEEFLSLFSPSEEDDSLGETSLEGPRKKRRQS